MHDLGSLPAWQPGVAPRVVIIDCETTGTDCATDQIIELSVQSGLEPVVSVRTWRIRPTAAEISAGAQAIHGIAAADLTECPVFGDICHEIEAVIAAADVIVGYNLAFDLEMLQAEFRRLERPGLDLADKQIVDALRLWQHCEPRSLQHAHQRFVGNGFDAAHSASADAAATGRVLTGMIKHFKLDGRDWAELASVCQPSRRR